MIFGSESANCRSGSAALQSFYDKTTFRPDVPWSLIAIAPALALFAGLPWVTREFDTGSFRYTWVQSISPRRWLLGTFGSLAVTAAAAAALCGMAFGWWFQLAQWQGLYPGYPWYWEHFELTPLSMASWTLLAMALALVIGVVVRRTVPAMAAFVPVYGAWLYCAIWWLRPHLFTLGAVVKPDSLGRPVSRMALERLPGGQLVHRAGRSPGRDRQHPPPDPAEPARDESADQWLARNHYTYWISYQPAAGSGSSSSPGPRYSSLSPPPASSPPPGCSANAPPSNRPAPFPVP